MDRRLELQSTLEDLVEDIPVYYQPPSNLRMVYPCIVYSWENQLENFADNNLYLRKRRYQVTVIDRDPDSEIPDKVGALPYCSMNTIFVSDDLNHFVYDLHF